MLTNGLRISDTTKTDILELNLFQSDKKIRQKYCRADLSILLGFLPRWLSISVLRPGFLGI